MSTHTPAPWFYDQEITIYGGAEPGNYVVFPESEPHHILAIVTAAPDGQENARMIATAPDLLAAAKRALNVLKAQGESVRPGNVLGALSEAIAKAEGH